jgi:hypothetical protein
MLTSQRLLTKPMFAGTCSGMDVSVTLEAHDVTETDVDDVEVREYTIEP